MLHLALHGLVPLAVAVGLYRREWLLPFGLMMSGMLIDLDHLLATPIYDPSRCSIGFHPLHSLIACAVYPLLLLRPRARLVGLGLCIHVVLDAIDCQVTGGVWFHPG